VLCDQLEHTQANLTRLEEEVERLIITDPATKGLQQMPELGPQTVAVLRAELGEVERFAHTDQAVAYAGMDIEIKESGKSERQSKALQAWQWLAAPGSLAFQPCAVAVWKAPP
jgi:transposase